MQHIATYKPEFAALPFKVKSVSTLGVQQQNEFSSLLTQANPVYSQPVQPNPLHVDKHANRSHDTSYVAESARQQSNQETSRANNQKETNAAHHHNDSTKQATPVQRESVANNKDIEKDKDSSFDSSQVKNENDTTTIAKNSSTEHAKPDTGSNTQQDSSDQQAVVDRQLENKVDAQNETTDEFNDNEGGSVDWAALVEKSQETNVDTSTLDIEAMAMGDIYLTQFLKESDGQPSELIGDETIVDFEFSTTQVVNVDNSQEINPEIAPEAANKEEIETTKVSADSNVVENLLAELATLLESKSTNTQGAQDIEKELDKLLTALFATTDEQLPISSENIESMLAKLESEGLDSEALLDVQLILSQQNVSAEKPLVQKSNSDQLLVQPMKADDGIKINTIVTDTEKETAKLDSEQANVDAAGKGSPVPTIDVVKVDAALQILIKQSPEKLDKSLDNLAQRLGLNDSVSAIEKSADSQVVDSPKQDFISAMKAGIEEIKAQLKQGHQPAIDLTALVNEAAMKSASTAVQPENIGQAVSRFNQALEAASMLNAKVDASSLVVGLEKSVAKDNFAQSQITQTKQAQQQMAQFDKAVNITRTEGQQQLAEKVRWMVNQNNLQADIRLDPPELGAMKVRVNLSGDSASVNIVVQSQQAREVLEQATPKLKELLEQQGIELGQSSVEQEQGNAEQNENSSFAGGNPADSDSVTDENVISEQRINNGRIGGIDYFV